MFDSSGPTTSTAATDPAASCAGTASSADVSRSSTNRAISPAATGLVSSAQANARLTSLLSPSSPRGVSSPTNWSKPGVNMAKLRVLGPVLGFANGPGFSNSGVGDLTACAGADDGHAVVLQASEAALLAQPVTGCLAMRPSGGGALQGDAKSAAAAGAGHQPMTATAMSDYDNSQAKPVYSSVQRRPSSAADLVLMCRRLWLMAWPLCWMEVLAFAKELIITSYVGHLGAAELSALVLAQTVYNVTGNAPMLGFVTAMETFCGQAFGAQRFKLVGLVLQRGLIISFMYCCAALWTWQFNGAVLVWMGQDPGIAAAAHKFTLALGPALFMDAADQCCRRYLSSQAVVQPLMCVTAAATLLTPLYLWLFVGRLHLGLLGAAVAWDAVQATSLALMVLCCWWHTKQQQPSRCTWPGWSRDAFREWRSYIRMALPSCVMICLDWWTFEVIVMLSGLLPRPEQTMAMMGITFNVHALCFFAAHGLSGAASTRVGNDLGAGRPQMAWLTVQVAVLLGTVVMCASSGVLLLSRDYVGRLFSSEHGVVVLTAQAVPPLAVSLIGEGANTVLAGVMRGCGRQRIGATINLVTYWLFGLPVACLMAFPGKLGALGLWTGLACTASVQALLMSLTVFRFNWVEEAARAKALVAAGELVLEEEPCLHSTGPSAATDALLSASAPHGCFVAGGFASMEVHHHPEPGLPGVNLQQKQQYAAQGPCEQQSWEGGARGSKGSSRTTSRSDKHQVQHGRQSPLDHRLQVS